MSQCRTRSFNDHFEHCFIVFEHIQQSSTESEIISLDAGLRLDGLPALELWDLIVSVFGSVSQISDRTGRPVDVRRNKKSQGKINVMEWSDQ